MAQGWRLCLPCRRCRFDPWVGKILWRRKWQPTPVFLPGESMDRRAWRTTESQTWLSMHAQNRPRREPFVHPFFEEHLMVWDSYGSGIALEQRDLKVAAGLESGKKEGLEYVSLRGQVERGMRKNKDPSACEEAQARREFGRYMPIAVSCYVWRMPCKPSSTLTPRESLLCSVRLYADGLSQGLPRGWVLFQVSREWEQLQHVSRDQRGTCTASVLWTSTLRFGKDVV